MVALFVVVFEAMSDEVTEVFESGVGSAGESVDRADGAVEDLEAGGDVLVERIACKGFGLAPGMVRLRVGWSDRNFGQRLLEVRAHVLEEEVVAAEDGGGDDDVGIHSPVGELEFAGESLAPAFGFAAGILVAYKKGGLDLFQKFLEGVVGVAAEDEAYSPLRGVDLYIAEPLLHEVVVAEVGVGVVGDDGEEDD